MATDGVTGLRTPRKRAHGKGMAQVHTPGASPTGFTGNPRRHEHLVQGLRHHGVGELPTATRDHEMRIGSGGSAPSAARALERRLGRARPREQPALVERGFAEAQPLGGDIGQRQGPRLRDPPPRDRQQPQQPPVRLGTSGAWGTKAPSGPQQWLELCVTNEVGGGTLPSSREPAFRRHLVPWIFGRPEAGTAHDRRQAVMPLGFRGRQGRPGKRGRRQHRGLPTCGGNACDVVSVARGRVQGTARCPAPSAIGGHRVHQQGGTSGQARTTVGSRGPSTLA
jgi:hypothetical protein